MVFGDWAVNIFSKVKSVYRGRGGAVVKVLRYTSEGHWFDFRLCHWNFSLT